MKCYKESHRVRKLTNILLVIRWKTVERAFKVQIPSLWHTLIYTDAHHSSQSFRSLVCSGTVRKFLQNPLIYSDCHFANNSFDIYRTRIFFFFETEETDLSVEPKLSSSETQLRKRTQKQLSFSEAKLGKAYAEK